MTLGTMNKKVGLMLGTLALAATYSVYTNFFENSTPAPSAPARRDPTQDISAAPVSAPAAASPSTRPRPLVNRNSRSDEFHPVLRKKNARPDEQQIRPEEIDPTLHFELLAKVQELKPEGGQRNLFQFGAAPVETKPIGPSPVIPIARVYDYPRPLPPKQPPAPPPPPPPPPPPSFKYYGLATKRIDNKRTAFFLDGEEIIFAIEGMTVKSRWRVVRIGSESVMLEDVQTKRQQPLKLSEDAGGTS